MTSRLSPSPSSIGVRILLALYCILSVLPSGRASLPGHVSNFTQPSPGTDPDFPGFAGNIQNLSSCSYIIPMDYQYQGCGNETDPQIGIINSSCDVCVLRQEINDPGVYEDRCWTSNPDFNLFAYGLVNNLLWNDIPVKWIIKTNKSHNEPDIVDAPVALLYPLRISQQTDVDSAILNAQPRSFRAGPFVVETTFTSFADPFITNYVLTVGEVRVYVTAAVIQVDVRYTLLSRPFVAVLASSGQQFILEATLLSAGFQRGLHFEVMTKEEAKYKLQTGVCITMAMEPHFHSSSDQESKFVNNSDAFVSAARDFLDKGSNLYAMCGGINTYEQCDDEDGVDCSDCKDDTIWNTKCSYCYGNTLIPLSTKYYPCSGPNEVLTDICSISNANVGRLSMSDMRNGSLIVGDSNSNGYPYGRSHPPYNNKYCSRGFFFSENVINSTMGGLRLPHPSLDRDNLNGTQIYAFGIVFVNMHPDIPFNQYEGDWEYEMSSSITHMSLWHESDTNDVQYASKPRSANWAHWTIAEVNDKRDAKTQAGYPYGIYYAAHAKLSQFHNSHGGNIFYIAGHYYGGNTRLKVNIDGVDYPVGYSVVQPYIEPGKVNPKYLGAYCVESGPTFVYNNDSTIKAAPAIRNGGGCFNKVGRRMLMNAVLTPSNLTCNRAIEICEGGKCDIKNVSVVLDPCLVWGICSASSFKKRAVLVSNGTNNTNSTSECVAPLRCSCHEVLDCCGVCGGNNSTCYKEVSPTTGTSGGTGNFVVTITGQPQMAFTGEFPPVPLPTLPGGIGASQLPTADVVAILFASQHIQPPLWPAQLGVSNIEKYSNNGPVTFTLASVPTDLAYTEQWIKDITISVGTVDPSRVVVTIVDTLVTIIVDGYGYPPAPTPQPASQPNNVTNITSYLEHKTENELLPDTCKFYTFTVGTNIYKVNVFVAIQTNVPDPSPVTLRLFLKKDQLPTPSDYDCVSQNITNNKEYMLTWVGSNFLGSSATTNIIRSCLQDVSLYGRWFVSICSSGGSDPILFSYQVSLLVKPSLPPVPEPPSSASIFNFPFLWLLFVGAFVYLTE